MVPRSLRWEVSPQKGETDLEGWFVYVNDIGIQFLQFLLGKKHNKLKTLNDEICSVRDKLSPLKFHDVYKQKSDHLRLFLEKEDNDQKIKKKRKYNRDLADYSNQVVFKWQIKTDEPMEGEGMNIPPTVPTQPPPPLLSNTTVPLIQAGGDNVRGHRGYIPRDGYNSYGSTKPKHNNKNKSKKNNNNHYRQSGGSQPPQQYDNFSGRLDLYSQRTPYGNDLPTQRTPYRNDLPPQRTPYRNDYKYQKSREYREDPRDSVNHHRGRPYRGTPGNGGVPLRNRFAPLSYYQEENYGLDWPL